MKTIVKSNPTKGRGLFARGTIHQGEIIEACHLIIMDLDDVHGVLESYVYQYSKTKAAIALGYGSLINHSKSPNSEFYFDYKKKLLLIEAKRQILPDEEITIDYRYTQEEKRKYRIKD